MSSHDESKLCSAQFSNVQVLQYYHWPMDGNTADVLGGLTSTAVGSPQFVSERIVGSASLRLDGGARILLDKHFALENETFAYTISFWFKPARLEGLQVIYEEGARRRRNFAAAQWLHPAGRNCCRICTNQCLPSRGAVQRMAVCHPDLRRHVRKSGNTGAVLQWALGRELKRSRQHPGSRG